MKSVINSKTLYIYIITILLTSCEIIIGKFLKDDEIERTVEPYSEQKIRLNGFYYHQYSEDSCKFNVYIFYSNGSCKYLSFDSMLINNIEGELLVLNGRNLLDLKTTNGAFWVLDSSTIEIRIWSPDNAYNRVFVEHIHLLNDSTFVKGKTWHIKNPENYYYIPDTFHYKETRFKPDSLFFENGLDKE